MSNGKVILSESDFVDVVDAAGNISSVPEVWLKNERLLPKGTKKATAANVRAAKAKTAAAAGESVDVEQVRADVEESLREEHEAALASRDKRIAELEQQLEDATKGTDPK
ncbi:hypothetical protein [Janibacter sp. LM]|uniref:hypothetical protein n=1 Tax=Janibacter sp. LM TaxID=3144845 RepID=UPI0031F6F8C7